MFLTPIAYPSWHGSLGLETHYFTFLDQKIWPMHLDSEVIWRSKSHSLQTFQGQNCISEVDSSDLQIFTRNGVLTLIWSKNKNPWVKSLAMPCEKKISHAAGTCTSAWLVPNIPISDSFSLFKAFVPNFSRFSARYASLFTCTEIKCQIMLWCIDCWLWS